MLAGGFGEGPKEANWVASVYARTGLGVDGPWRHFLGRVRSEPVATSSLFLNGATGGIYFVCTSPEFRRRGYGAAITHRSMLEAARCMRTMPTNDPCPLRHQYQMVKPVEPVAVSVVTSTWRTLAMRGP